MRAAWTRRRLFKPVTDETREKQRLAALGNTRRVGTRHTEETRAKLRAAWARRKGAERGRPNSALIEHGSNTPTN
jgi:hypothetical protein